MSVSIGLFLALLTALLWAVFDLVSRSLSVRSKNPLALSVLYNILGAVFSLAFLLIEPGKFIGVTTTIIALTFLITVLYGIVEATQFFARKYLEVSYSSILFQLTPVVTLAGAILFLGEHATSEKILGTGFVIAGNIVVVYRHGGGLNLRGIAWIVTTIVAMGFAFVVAKIVFTSFPIGFYMALTYFLPALYILPLIRGNCPSALFQEWVASRWNILLLVLVSVLGSYTFLKAISIAEVSIAVPIVNTSTIFAVLGGIVFLGERAKIPQKIIGIVLAFVGVTILGIV